MMSALTSTFLRRHSRAGGNPDAERVENRRVPHPRVVALRDSHIRLVADAAILRPSWHRLTVPSTTFGGSASNPGKHRKVVDGMLEPCHDLKDTGLLGWSILEMCASRRVVARGQAVAPGFIARRGMP